MRAIATLLGLAIPLVAQYSAKVRPQFEDFPAEGAFQGPNAPVQLLTFSERMFKTRLTEASKAPPNFAGHLRFVSWGCGANCGAGALVDLTSGRVIQPPLAEGSTGVLRWAFMFGFYSISSPAWEHRPDSRLFVLRVGMTDTRKFRDYLPDTYYYLWENGRFRLLLRVPADESAVRGHQK